MKSKILVLIALLLVAGAGVFLWWRQSSDVEPGQRAVEELSEAEIISQGAASEEPVIDEELTELLETSDLSDITVREQLAARVRAREEAVKIATHARAERLGIPIREEWDDGRIVEIQGFEGDIPLYFSTFNRSAAEASGADSIRNIPPYNVSGRGVTVGVWDSGKAYNEHRALGTESVVIMDKAESFSNHATHVTGTITADDRYQAPGMAPATLVHSRDWNFDISEMLLDGAGSSVEGDRVSISNHSYGQLGGYEGAFTWFGALNLYGGRDDLDELEAGWVKSDGKFGRYSDRSRVVDTVTYSAPYLTSFFAAGNDRNHNPKAGDFVQIVFSEGSIEEGSSRYHRDDFFKYVDGKSPKGDGEWRNGFENICGAGVAKNNITVGAVKEVTGDRGMAEMSVFSSWGPTDDGRIKPDLVANGVNVYSTTSDGDYKEMSGTSMASPSAAGSAALLVELYRKQFNEYGQSEQMRSSLLKALLIHTADDVGRPGPDYTFGWGLINVKKAADVMLDHEKFMKKTSAGAGQRWVQGVMFPDKEPYTFYFQSDGKKEIRATLCWTDPAGPAQSETDKRTSVLSHNLDLLITGPNGELHRPFTMPYVGDWRLAKLTANATRGKNNTDNVEQVFDKANPTLNGAGLYKVTVSLEGSLKKGIKQQLFSVVLTGGEALPAWAPVIAMEPSLNFGKVSGGRSRTLNLPIHNVGDDDLVVTGIDFGENPEMSGDFAGTIEPGGVGVAPITYTPDSQISSEVVAEEKWFGTLKVLSNAKAGRTTVPLARSVKGKSNYSSQLLRPEPGIEFRKNYIDNLVGSEWSYDWKEESYTNRFAFNKDGTVRIIVVDNPNYRGGDVKAGMEWMPIGPNQVKVYFPGSLHAVGKYPNYEEAILLKFTSAKTFETNSLNGKAIVGRRYGEPGKGEDFTKGIEGKLLKYDYHEGQGSTINDFSTNFEMVFALMQANGNVKPFDKDDVHGLWDSVTWDVHGTNVIRFYNKSTRQEMFMHLVASRYAAFKSYVTIGWNGNNVVGMLMPPWKTNQRPDDLTKRNERSIEGNFGEMEMIWKLPGVSADELRGHWTAHRRVSNKEWRWTMGTNPRRGGGANNPAKVTHYELREWIKKMNAKYPLPKGTTWGSLPKYDSSQHSARIDSGFTAIIVPAEEG